MKRILPFFSFALSLSVFSSCAPDGTSLPIAPGSVGGVGGSAPGAGGTTSSGSGGNSPATGGGATGGSSGSGTGGVETGSIGGANDSGGGPSTGSQSGTGGGFEQTLPWGYMPERATMADAQVAYDAWKTVHLEDCGGGVHRVRWENAKLDATVSEGIGYGMLLTVAFDDRAAFDGLLAYGKLMRGEGSSLMNWLRYGCDAHWDMKYNAHPDGAASDADLDVAMALIMAECRWGDSKYTEEARAIVRAIKQHMFIGDNGREVLQPGDSTWFDMMGGGCVNYSYFAPAYYREFAKLMPEDGEFWNKAADDTYPLLAVASDSSTGLVRNWGSAGGGDATADCHNAYHRSASYGDDAARTPWRVATDYLWYGKAEAKAWNDKVTAWVKSVGIKNTVQWYLLNGSPDTEANTYTDHTVINVGPFAVGAMTMDAETVDEFAAEVVAIPTSEGSHDAEYFPRMLKALSLLALVGKFDQCGGK